MNFQKMLAAFLYVAGGALSADALALIIFSNVHTGHFVTLGLGAAFCIFAFIYNRIALWLKILFFSLTGLLIVICAVLIIYGSTDNCTYNEDAVIVLGASVHGERPSASLRSRLDAAVNYHRKNKNAVILVSGGKGPQEKQTEAEVMAQYLIDCGVDENKIMLESSATSSQENFAFSKALLDARFEGEYSISYITNEYHIYRAGVNARMQGFEDASHMCSSTPIYAIVPNTLRELLAIAKTHLFIY
ncbi:MAG: YdcF family protein [Clostridia bacterium]|nr:YdcF family protein [Clostridia bacterium]